MALQRALRSLMSLSMALYTSIGGTCPECSYPLVEKAVPTARQAVQLESGDLLSLAAGLASSPLAAGLASTPLAAGLASMPDRSASYV